MAFLYRYQEFRRRAEDAEMNDGNVVHIRRSINLFVGYDDMPTK